jgi:hypothetical protein
MRAHLYSDGKIDDVKDMLIIVETIGANSAMQSFSSHVGRGSRMQCFDFIVLINEIVSVMVTVLN